MASNYSPPLTVDVPQFDGPTKTVTYYYCLGFGEDPDETGWQEQWTEEDGLEIEVKIACVWEDRITLMQALRGQTKMTGNGLNVRRIVPTLRLDPPGNTVSTPMEWARYACTSFGPVDRIGTKIAQEGAGSPGGIYCDLVVVPCNFRVPLYATIEGNLDQSDPSGKTYTVTTMKPAGEVVCPPAGAYRYKDNPNLLVQDTQAGFYFGRTELTIQRIFMPHSGADQMQAVVGCINSDPIEFPDITFPTGTVLLEGIENRPYIDVATGRTVWDITYQCLVNAGKNGTTAVSWNKIMNPKGIFAEIVNKDGEPPFPSVDLNTEFWPDIIEG